MDVANGIEPPSPEEPKHRMWRWFAWVTPTGIPISVVVGLHFGGQYSFFGLPMEVIIAPLVILTVAWFVLNFACSISAAREIAKPKPKAGEQDSLRTCLTAFGIFLAHCATS